jgi:hypothetical protein
MVAQKLALDGTMASADGPVEGIDNVGLYPTITVEPDYSEE